MSDINNDILERDWESDNLDHGQVEDQLKAKIAELKGRIDSAHSFIESLEEDLETLQGSNAEKYKKPDGGIPKTDLSSDLQGKIDNAATTDDLKGKANLRKFGNDENIKMLDVNEWPRQVIHDITGGATGAKDGDVVYNATEKKLYGFSTIGTSLDMGEPRKGTVYCDKQTKRTYIWNNRQFERVSDDGIGTSVIVDDEYINVHVDGYDGDYSGAAVDVIANMNAIKNKVNELIRGLSSIAFTGDKPAELDDLDWGGTEKPVPELVQPSGTLPINVSNNGDNSTPISVTIKGNNLTDNLAISFTESKEMLSDNGHFVISPLIVTAADANKGTTIDISFTGNETEDGYLYIRSSEVSKFVRIRGTYHSEYQPD